MSEQWLEWARRIQAISQSGLHFTRDAFDKERYEELRAISAAIMAKHSEWDIREVEQLFKQEEGYQTPKMDVRGVVFQNNKILLVKEKVDGLWALPGGFCEVGMSPGENAVKEIKEESGYETKVHRLLGLLDLNKHPHPPQPYHYYKVFIACHIVGGKPEASMETSHVQFFAEDRLPSLSTGRNTAAQIHTLFEYNRNPSKQAMVD